MEIDGERYIDGAVVDNVPIRRAIDGGATRIVVLLCAPPVYSAVATRRPVEAMLNALLISIHARFRPGHGPTTPSRRGRRLQRRIGAGDP